jgi:hypothetical protein
MTTRPTNQIGMLKACAKCGARAAQAKFDESLEPNEAEPVPA